MLETSDEVALDEDRAPNVLLLENIKTERMIKSMVTRAALRYSGHVVKEERVMCNGEQRCDVWRNMGRESEEDQERNAHSNKLLKTNNLQLTS